MPIGISPGTRLARWTPNGKSIAYIDLHNVWAQPLDGGKPVQLTRFTDPTYSIVDYAWSFDGEQLAIALMTKKSDVVAIKGLRRK